MASATLVRTAGRTEWISNFCSSSVYSSRETQYDGPRFFSISMYDAPLHANIHASECTTHRCTPTFTHSEALTTLLRA